MRIGLTAINRVSRVCVCVWLGVGCCQRLEMQRNFACYSAILVLLLWTCSPIFDTCAALAGNSTRRDRG